MLRWCGSQIYAALAAAQRQVRHGTFPRHPHRQGPHRVNRLLRVKADAALGRAARVVVLHAEAAKDPHGSIVHAYRQAEVVLPHRMSQQVFGRLIQTKAVGHLVKLALRHRKRIERLVTHESGPS
jgi:hypothetical protein